MKTTKKGFTLIELIVVIAIIGVLAAILVPSMLGYVRKSKISSANSTAASIQKAINSALTELDEEGEDVGGVVTATYSGGSWSVSDLGGDDAIVTRFGQKISQFFSDITKVNDKGGEVQAQLDGGTCVALAVAVDSTYVGTYPAGVVTTDTYADYKGTSGVPTALAGALDKANWSASGSSDGGDSE